MANEFEFFGIRPLHDGLPLGTADNVVLDLPGGRGTYRWLMEHLHREGWDCNGVEYTVRRKGSDSPGKFFPRNGCRECGAEPS
jgi:hypothetical protein